MTYPEHPEKLSFGDMDVILCDPQGNQLRGKSNIRELRADIAQIIGTERNWTRGIECGYFGLEIPQEILGLAEDGWVERAREEYADKQNVATGIYIQVDIEIVSVPSQFPYAIMISAHATLLPILRFGLRPAGFVFLPKGLLVRMPEAYDLKEGWTRPPMVFLSNDPEKILEFFGLPINTWCETFKSSEEYWRRVTKVKYFSRQYLDNSDGHILDEDWECDDIMKKKKKPSFVSYYGYCQQRPAWQEFLEEWFPQHPEIGAAPVCRDLAFQDALDFFGATATYHRHREEWLEGQLEVQFWEDVKKEVYLDLSGVIRKNRVNQGIIAVKRYVKFEDRFSKGPMPVIQEVGDMKDLKFEHWIRFVRSSSGGFSEEELRHWVVDHVEEIRELSRGPIRAKRLIDDQRKLERKREKAKRATLQGRIVCWFLETVAKMAYRVQQGVQGVEYWWFPKIKPYEQRVLPEPRVES